MNEFGNQVFIVLCNGAIATALFVVLLLNHKNVRRSRANLFLSILLIALAFSIVHILYAGTVINHFSGKMYSPGDPTFLLIAPLSWFYAVELTGQRVSFSWRLLLHFMPFSLVILLSMSFGFGQPNALAVFIGNHKRLLNVFFWLMVVIQFSRYQYITYKKWHSHQKLLQQEVSNTENINIAWVNFFLVVFLIINLFFLFSLFTAIHWENGIWLQKATAVVFAASVFALSFQGILQRDIFNTSIIIPEPLKPGVDIPLVVNIQAKPDQALIETLVTYMTTKKPYLDSELSLSSLAKDINISRSQLSQLINDGLGENFYDFVNKYRVEEIKNLMTDPEMANYSLLGIAFEAGFKSKSTFNLIFKRFTGLTPTEYRKNLLK